MGGFAVSDLPAKPKRILVVSGPYPSIADTSRGIFVHQRVKALSQIEGIEVQVVAPTPWAPPFPNIKKWRSLRRMPSTETYDGLIVHRPRYLLPPKVGGYFHPSLMYPSLLKAVRRIRKEFAFEVVDSHFVYPAGVAATRVARRLGVPVSLTGRGEDMMRFPSMPLKGPRIRWALAHANRCVGVSKQISDEMVKHGADPSNVCTISNGVDTERFYPKPSKECQRLLGLPENKKFLITVGDRLELKGFHIIIEALPLILKTHPDLTYICVGGAGRHGQDFTPQIRSQIDRLGLNDRVVLVGAKSHDELVDWYNAADLYVLASSREGSPNVLMESLACGVPAVATRVGSAPDELEQSGFGFIMDERTPEAAAEAVIAALKHSWDRVAIRRAIEKRTWSCVADATLKNLAPLFDLPSTKPGGKSRGEL